MRCDITKYSKSSDISAFKPNVAVAWICHLNVTEFRWHWLLYVCQRKWSTLDVEIWM